MGASFKAKFRTKISKISHLQDPLGVAMLRVLTYERPAGPGVGEPSVLPSDRHSGYPEGNAAGGEGCGVSGYGGGPATGEGYLTGRGGGWGGSSGGGAGPPAEAP